MTQAIAFQYDDGGRAAAGFRGHTGDCVTRAVAIATGRPYIEVYNDLAALGKQERRSKRRTGKSHPRTGVHSPTVRRYMASLGWRWVPTMQIGQGCKVHLRTDELPKGSLVVSVSRHDTAVIDGVLHDTYDCSRDGTRCVYGYYLSPESEVKCAKAFRGALGYQTCTLPAGHDFPRLHAAL